VLREEEVHEISARAEYSSEGSFNNSCRAVGFDSNMFQVSFTSEKELQCTYGNFLFMEVHRMYAQQEIFLACYAIWIDFVTDVLPMGLSITVGLNTFDNSLFEM
jgi:hypothetical protein